MTPPASRPDPLTARNDRATTAADRDWSDISERVQMKKFLPVARLSELAPGSCLSVEADGIGVALFNVDGRIYALDNTCPHAGGPLGEGTLSSDIVECPWHGWRYNVRTGERPENPAFKVACYDVHVEGGVILVALPAS